MLKSSGKSMKNRHLPVLLSLCVTIMSIQRVAAINQSDSTVYFGSYYPDNPLNSEIIENASFGIYYRCTEKATNNSSKEVIVLQDTLLLAVGKNVSLFFDQEFSAKYSKWIRENRARGRKITTPRPPVVEPLASLKNMLDYASDIGYRDVGNPVHVYKYRNTGIVVSADLFGSFLRTSQQIPQFSQWTMESGSEEILGYSCMKASTHYGGKRYTAYFTPEIPVSDGPWKFHGLPGMILKVSDDDDDYTYEAISLEYFHEAVIVSSVSKLTDSSLSEFEKASNANREEIVTVFLYQGSEYQAGEYPYTLWTREQ